MDTKNIHPEGEGVGTPSQGSGEPKTALCAKGTPATLYPKNSQRCAWCGGVLPRRFHSEFRASLGRMVAWSVLDEAGIRYLRDGTPRHRICPTDWRTA